LNNADQQQLIISEQTFGNDCVIVCFAAEAVQRNDQAEQPGMLHVIDYHVKN